MRRLIIAGAAGAILAGSGLAPGRAQEEQVEDAVARAEEAAGRAVRGELEEDSESESKACAILQSGMVEAIFGVESSSLTIDAGHVRGITGHDYCAATWDRPNRAALEAGYQEAIMAWARNGARGEQPKIARLQGSVNLTISHPTYGSSGEAVAALESMVETMTKGREVEIQGKKRTISIDYGAWLDGIGDRAVTIGERKVQVAAGGTIFTVGASVADEPADDHDLVLEAARRVVREL